ncbi:pantoate--beta-alanine ligase [Longimicrobium sp.]|uniref:pantoate--beta-alanine ligase n=1 Tax=Longimicrobium sp. TaxID=2029185 RepID=UPI002C59DDA5|nr:pantoate--beta-alanine ligase [Longimicrobium sp.]HSU14440.1 pantoate--beta-alanine ligase [Longimicrobium sp.]
MSVESLAAAECIDVAAAECADAAPVVARTKAEVRAWVAEQRAAGKRVGLVPTMGYLHDGHLSLIDRARETADVVAVSIFVNPLQFGPAEDLDRYPRDLERDLALAASRGTELVFAPSAADMYPEGEPRVSVLPDEEIGGRLDGGARPGHFRGVLTVVAKLFGIFTPDMAVFGQKDFQQAALIRRMALDLDQGVRVEVAPIVREPDGLAMSSRNVYLSPEERERARALSRGLEHGRALFAAGERDAEALRAALWKALEVPGVQAEYAEAANPLTLEPVATADSGTVLLVAARVGRTRLIDNAVLS